MGYCILGYCILSWLIGWTVTRSAMLSQCRSSGTLNVHCAAARCFMIASAPLWVLYGLVTFVPRTLRLMKEYRELQQVVGRYRENLFQPVPKGEEFADLSRIFDDAAAPFALLGFDHAADYLNKDEPFVVCNRYFLSDDRLTVGDLTFAGGECGPGFFSILADGMYVETADSGVEGLETPEANDFIHVVNGTGLAIREMYETHIQALVDLARRRGTQALALAPDQIPTTANYGQRRFWAWRKRLGEVSCDVPAPEMPLGAPTPIAEPASC